MASLLRYRCSFCVNIKTSVLIYCTRVRDYNCQLAPICESPLYVMCPYMQGNVTNHGHFETKIQSIGYNFNIPDDILAKGSF